jgi:hypothetical protein
MVQEANVKIALSSEQLTKAPYPQLNKAPTSSMESRMNVKEDQSGSDLLVQEELLNEGEEL